MNDTLKIVEEVPLVSVITLAYNHESYIRDCLEGILMQKTSFKFELIIHDDASTDGTAEIIREYVAKYPDIIKPIYQSENQYSKGVPIGRTFLYPRVKGKYIAECEGDDYWIDPFKLQKQVDLLELDSEIAMVHTDVNVLYQESGIVSKCYNRRKKLLNSKSAIEKIAIKNILNGQYFVKTATVLFRKDLHDEYVQSSIYKYIQNNFPMGDTPLWVYLAYKKKIAYLDEVTAVYRRNSGSVSNPKSKQNKLYFDLKSSELRKYCIDVYNVYDMDFREKNNRIYEKRLFNYLCFSPNYQYKYSVSPFMEKKIELIRHVACIRSLLKYCYGMKISFLNAAQLIYHKYLLK